MLGSNCPLHICLRWDQMRQILSAICGTVSERKSGNKLKWGEVGKKTTIFPFLCALFPNRLVTSILNPHRLLPLSLQLPCSFHLTLTLSHLLSPHPSFKLHSSLCIGQLLKSYWCFQNYLHWSASTMQCKDIDLPCV